jgi:hypothetical protein
LISKPSHLPRHLRDALVMPRFPCNRIECHPANRKSHQKKKRP